VSRALSPRIHVGGDVWKGSARYRRFVRADIEYNGVRQIWRRLYDMLKNRGSLQKEIQSFEGSDTGFIKIKDLIHCAKDLLGMSQSKTPFLL